jgi:hypothetical protein
LEKSTPSVLQTKAIIIGGFKATASVADKLNALPDLGARPEAKSN